IWHDITPSKGTFDRDSLFALNDKTAWAVSSPFESSNWVWRTQDGGSTWHESGPLPVGTGVYNPIHLQFPDEQHGWLLAQNDDHLILYKSANGGQDWMQINSIPDGMAQAYLPADANMAFLDGERGWLGGVWEQN